MRFENKARIVFWVAIGVIFLLGGWIFALVFFIGWVIPYSLFMTARSIAIYSNENWGAGKVFHEPVTPREMNRK